MWLDRKGFVFFKDFRSFVCLCQASCRGNGVDLSASIALLYMQFQSNTCMVRSCFVVNPKAVAFFAWFLGQIGASRELQSLCHESSRSSNFFLSCSAVLSLHCLSCLYICPAKVWF